MLYRVSDVLLDADKRTVQRGGRKVALQDRAFDVLVYLVRRAGRVVSRDELLATFWPDQEAGEQVLSQVVYLARRALGDDARGQRCIRTVRGRGFQLVADPVEELPGSGSHLFVGRGRELDLLRRAFDRSRREAGVAILVSGPPGIGKSYLLQRFLAEIEALGARVRRGRCVEAAGAPAFWPWRQVLGSPADWTAELGGLLGTSTADRSTPESRQPVFEQIVHALEDWARSGPVVLAFDDLHRADPSSLELFRFVMERAESPDLCLVGALREAEFMEAAPQLARLLATTSIESLPLAGFGPEEAGDLAEQLLGRRPDAAEVEAWLMRTAGNPFYLDQLLRTSRQGVRDSSTPVPVAVQALVREQMQRLNPDAARTLELGAVLGREIDPVLAARILERSHADVIAALGRARRLDLVAPAPDDAAHWRFPHVLVRDALYAQMATEQVAGLHKAVLDALGAGGGVRDADAAAAAHHAERAASLGAVPHPMATRQVLHAARVAIRQLAYEDARRHARRALELLNRSLSGPLPSDRLDVLLVLGEASVRCGERAAAREIFREASVLAEELGTAEALARVALGVVPGLLCMEISSWDPLAVELLERAAALLPDTASGLKSRVLGLLAMGFPFTNRGEVRLQWAAEACRLAETSGDPLDAGFARVCRFATEWRPETFEQRLRELPDVLATTERLGNVELDAMSQTFWLATLLEAGEIARFEQALERFERHPDVSRVPQLRWYSPLQRCIAATFRGQLALAERQIDRIFEDGQKSGDTNQLHGAAASLFTVRIHQGRIEELAPLVERMARNHPEVGAWAAANARVLATLGRAEQAALELARLMPRGVDDIRRDNNHWLSTVAFASEAAALPGVLEDSRAEELFSSLEPHAGRFVTGPYGGFFWGSAARILGMLARRLGSVDRAVELLKRADTYERQAGAHAWRVWTLLGLGEALLARGERGDHDEAARTLDGARKLASALEMRGPEPRLRAALEACAL